MLICFVHKIFFLPVGNAIRGGELILAAHVLKPQSIRAMPIVALHPCKTDFKELFILREYVTLKDNLARVADAFTVRKIQLSIGRKSDPFVYYLELSLLSPKVYVFVPFRVN